jgi:hypothetical protein
MSTKSRTDFDRRLVNLAIQIEADSLIRESENVSKKQIDNIENNLAIKNETETDFDRRLVNLAIQIEASSLMRESENVSKNQIYNIENKASKSVGPVVPIKQDPINISLLDEDDWVVLSFVLKLFGILAFLVCFVVGIVVWNVIKSDPVIDLCRRSLIGDGVCDDHQNTPECEYDGMDCCLIKMVTKYCDDCKCHQGM